MDNRPVIIVAFANNSDSHLPHLSDEIKNCLKVLQNIDHEVKIVPIFNTSIIDIQTAIKDFGDRLVAFMFSGHAGQLEINTTGHSMSAIGLSNELSKCPNLKLVILNGCNSDGHIDHLNKASIPMIIATQSPIGDYKASIFSASFFTELTTGNTLESSFDKALKNAQNYDNSSIAVNKSIEKTRFLNGMSSALSNQWLLLTENQKNNEWSIFDEVKAFKKSTKYKPNQKLQDFLFDSLKVIDEKIAETQSYSDSEGKILEKFPPFISKYIHDLCASKVGDFDTGQYFDQPDIFRLQKLSDFFTAIQEVLLCIVLAEIRELYMDAKDIVQGNSEHHFKLLQIPKFNKMTMLTDGIQLLIDSKSSLLINEIGKIDEPKRKQLIEIANYFEEVDNRIKIAEKELDNTEKLNIKHLYNLCENSEIKLVSLLEITFFLVNYKFVSIKNITVFKNRAKRNPLFDFDLSVYEWQRPGQEDPSNKAKKNLIEQVPDNFSVLVLETSGNMWELIKKGQYLNVSPFMIDKNVVYEKATIPHISFLDVYSDEELTYRSLFRRDVKNNINGDTVAMKDIFDDLQSQFTHFNNLLNPLKS
jgi:hypothetical protein